MIHGTTTTDGEECCADLLRGERPLSGTIAVRSRQSRTTRHHGPALGGFYSGSNRANGPPAPRRRSKRRLPARRRRLRQGMAGVPGRLARPTIRLGEISGTDGLKNIARFGSRRAHASGVEASNYLGTSLPYWCKPPFFLTSFDGNRIPQLELQTRPARIALVGLFFWATAIQALAVATDGAGACGGEGRRQSA